MRVNELYFLIESKILLSTHPTKACGGALVGIFWLS